MCLSKKIEKHLLAAVWIMITKAVIKKNEINNEDAWPVVTFNNYQVFFENGMKKLLIENNKKHYSKIC